MPNIIFGLVAIALGLWGLTAWWYSVSEALRGLMPIILVLVGLVALGAGITSMRETKRPMQSDMNESTADRDE
ncbi:MAG: hypothetical protein G8345_08120 [Magnetococcales bacterium]|nr:hypothetical protein [Magnetococcales bacterium]NGZ26840.1 hypothetical protein [Magnetococcales bacterium]